MILIHEWWGLNDQIKAVAADFANAGYIALAVDLYNGEVAKDGGAARRLSGGLKAAEANDTLVAWVDWLRAHNSGNGKVGTVGRCFGGGTVDRHCALRVCAQFGRGQPR